MCLSLFKIQNLCQFWAISGFSQKDTHTAFSFLFSSVLLKCWYHSKGKFGMYFPQPSFCVFEWCGLNKFKLFIKRDHHRTLLDGLWSKQRSDTALQKVSQIRQWVIKSSSRLDFIRLVLFTTCYKYHSKSRGYLLICLINCQGEICDQSIKNK